MRSRQARVSPGLVVAAVGSILLCVGIALVAHATRWTRLIAVADRDVMQALGGALRVLMGLALVYAARDTRYPEAVHAFGLVLVAVGVMILWVSPTRFRSWIDRWIVGSLVWRLRVGGALSIFVGAFLVWAAIG
jgi:uncharacterized protein YjeT (DUF2065 family)